MTWYRITLAILCVLLCCLPLYADVEETGRVVKVRERLVYVNLGRGDGVQVGDLFQIFRRAGDGSEKVIGTVRVIEVDDRLSFMEPMEEGVQVAVLDIVRPTVILLHEPPASGIAGESLPLSVTLKEGGMIGNATIVYHMAGSKIWMSEPMVQDGEQSFTGAIPGRASIPPFVEYFIRITTKNGKTVSYGSSEQPISVAIEEGGRRVTGSAKRPGRWRLLIPGLYQMSEGRVGAGVSLAVLELGSVGGGVVLWPKQDLKKYKRERQWMSRGLWGLGAFTFLYGALDSFVDGRTEVAWVEVKPEILVERSPGLRVTVRL